MTIYSVYRRMHKVFESIAGFPSPCFNAHFEVSHEKQVMEMPNLVVFDLCEKGLMRIMGDGKMHFANKFLQVYQKSLCAETE